MMRRWANLLAVAVLFALLVLAASARSVQAGFPGYNGKIAFSSNRTNPYGAFGDIWVIDPDGRHPTQITDSPELDEVETAWSPAGERIVFRESLVGDIYVLNLETGTSANLTQQVGGYAVWPTWSPDGSKIAFTLDDDAQRDIYVMNADGTGLTNLTDSDLSSENDPAWSPDGAKIAYWFEGRDFVTDIHVMNTDGTGDLNLTRDSAQDIAPAWSPSGQEIVFVSDRARGGRTYTDLFVMDSDGRHVRRLTDGPFIADMPDWSPDDRFITFTGRRWDDEIFRIPASGGIPLRLTGTEALTNWYPSWQPTAVPPAPEISRKLSVSPRSGIAGTVVTVTGEGCGEPGETVKVGFEGSPDGVAWGRGDLVTTKVDDTGRFQVNYTLPTSIERGPWPTAALAAGKYAFFSDPLGCEAEFTVEADAEWTDPAQYQTAPYQHPPGTVPVGGGPPGGGDDFTLVALGSGMLTLSFALIAAALTRRPQP